jgi:putative hydrolase of the HAD superfamily
MCNLLKIEPKDCLFVGDNPSRDIKGAKEVGMKTAWAKYGHVNQYVGYSAPNKEDEKLADFVLEKPSKLIEVVE